MIAADWTFAIDGDLHYDAVSEPGVVNCRKPNSVAKLVASKPEFVICPGDMLCSAADGSAGLFECWDACKKPRPNEFTPFVDMYLKPLAGHGIKAYLCPGNHDFSRMYPSYRMLKYIRDTHGATYTSDSETSGCYSFQHRGIGFIVCGVYPKDVSWLKAELKKYHVDMPLWFVWHYNTDVTQPYSDWWTIMERGLFLDAIKGRVVLGIINGHLHVNAHTKWMDIPVILGSGDDKMVLVNMIGDKIGSIANF